MAAQGPQLVLVHSPELCLCNLTQSFDFFKGTATSLRLMVLLHRFHSVVIHGVIGVKNRFSFCHFLTGSQ